MKKELVIGTPADLAAALVRRLETLVPHRLAEAGRCSLALTGGSMAEAFFPHLAAARVDWTGVDFFWGDERAVPPDDPESNYAAADRRWLGPAAVPPGRRHRPAAELPDLTRAAALYEAELVRLCGRPPRLDVALVGVGPDGHVCSLFPGHPLLEARDRFVAALDDSPKPPARRLTLTLPALTSAGLVVIAALGAAKAAVVREVWTDGTSRLPVARLSRESPHVMWLVDADAATGEPGSVAI